MIGSAFKKYANELHFTIHKGVAYGEYRQYLLTFSEGMGWKKVVIGVSFPDQNSKAAVQVFLMDQKFRASHRITEAFIEDSAVTLIFQDTMGTVKVVRNTVEEVLDQFTELDIKGVGFCNYCGQAFAGDDKEKILYNERVLYMHSGCVGHLSAEVNAATEDMKSEGSVARGTVGAVIGALIGAVPWAVAYYFGWFVGWLGFLIGLAAKKGYELFKGKNTKAKAVVVSIVVFLTVILVEYVTLIIGCWTELPPDYGSASLGDVIQYVNTIIPVYREIQIAMIKDILMGWLFAGLGIFSMVRDIFKGAKAATTLPERLDS